MMAGKALGPTVVHAGLNCPDPLAGKANNYAAAGRLLETDLAECLATVAVKAEPVSLPVASFDVGFGDDGRVTETAIGSITDFVGGVKIMREAGGANVNASLPCLVFPFFSFFFSLLAEEGSRMEHLGTLRC
jgi:hypothetical protein